MDLHVKISVLIPAYNAERTIRATLDSVLNQTFAPSEILLMDDGSTDRTVELVASFAPRVSLYRQENGGVATARNALVARAQGDLVAFLDSDDIWHPNYLKEQRKLVEQYPEAVCFVMGHVDFSGYDDFVWRSDSASVDANVEILPPTAFLRRYSATPGMFVMNCCVPRSVLSNIGPEPFKRRYSEDCYFYNLLVLRGSAVYSSAQLVAYRIREGSNSSSRLNTTEGDVRAFELLAKEHYSGLQGKQLHAEFRKAFASKRRSYAKVLLSAERTHEAQNQLRLSISDSADYISWAKSLALLYMSRLPGWLQPQWLAQPIKKP
jgi:glycosyltransferase involved in cell wall biosynthesis